MKNKPRIVRDSQKNIKNITFTISPSDAPKENRLSSNLSNSVTGMFYFIAPNNEDYNEAIKLLEKNEYKFKFNKNAGNYYSNISTAFEKSSKLSKQYLDELDSKIISFKDIERSNDSGKYLRFDNTNSNGRLHNSLLKKLFFPDIVEVVLDYNGEIYLNINNQKNYIDSDEKYSQLNNDIYIYNGKEQTVLEEGKKVVYLGYRYERKKSNRDQAIHIHGTICKACKFDFSKKYGEIGNDFIEIHHAIPLHVEHRKNSVVGDFVPLCSNCHRIVHRKKDEVLSLEKLIEIIHKNEKYN